MASPLVEKHEHVALTGYGQGADRERSLEAGFLEHFVKPVKIAELGRVLEQHLRRERERGAASAS